MTGGPPVEPPGSDERLSEDLRLAFGKNFREARLRAGLTQAQVAERTGLTQQHVSEIEAGRVNLTLATMVALARVVGQEVVTLLQRSRSGTATS